MSSKLHAVTARDVVRVATHLGFVFDHQKGSHAVYYRAQDKARVVIPMHARKDLKPKTLKGILEDMGVSSEDFQRFLRE